MSVPLPVDGVGWADFNGLKLSAIRVKLKLFLLLLAPEFRSCGLFNTGLGFQGDGGIPYWLLVGKELFIMPVNADGVAR